jgi:acetolactate synthase I/II/III large subunit
MGAHAMRAADAIVKCLEAHSVRRVYCVPGESYLALLDALHGSSIDIIVCRHESGAGFMAVAEAKLTGKPAICMVSRGPGATNASIAVHVAEQDAAPLILLIGQVARDELTRGAFQEVDYGKFFGGMAKAVYEVQQGRSAAEMLTRSFRLAAEGTPGPVVLSLPEDALLDDAPDEKISPFPLASPRHSTADTEAIASLIDASSRPLVMAGGSLRGAKGAAALAQFAEAFRIPVAVTWKNQDVFDNGSPLYAGHIGFGAPAGLRDKLSQADLIFAVGTRLGDVASLGYSFPKAPYPPQKLIHVHADGAAIGRNARTDIGLVADPVALLADLGQNVRVVSSARASWAASLNEFVRGFQIFASPEPDDGIDFGKAIMSIARHAPPDAVVTTDAGNMSTWVHRHWIMTPKNVLLGAIAGAMGVGVPFAVAASLIEPHRTVICVVGDGGTLMTGHELATAMQYGARPKIVVSDNGIYGTIRLHQEREYPGRVSGTNLTSPDFAAWARSFGAEAFTLKMGEDVDAAVKTFLAHQGAAVLHVKSSRKAISAYTTIQ